MKLAVFFPGIGYHCDKPLLYYSRKLVQEYGYEKIVTLNYTYDGKNLRGNEDGKRKANFIGCSFRLYGDDDCNSSDDSGDG